MSLGASLLWIAVLVLLALGIRHVSKNKKWRLVAKITGALILLSVLIGFGVWGWNLYKERPQPLDKLGAVSLGMTPVEVSLALGKPDNTDADDRSDGHRRYLYMEYGTIQYFVKFSDGADSPEHVEAVCSGDFANGAFGLSKYSSEEHVIKKLGSPPSQSINQDGLRKMISYPKWKVSFEIEKNSVTNVCVSENGEMKYLEEYGQDSNT